MRYLQYFIKQEVIGIDGQRQKRREEMRTLDTSSVIAFHVDGILSFGWGLRFWNFSLHKDGLG